MPDQLGTLERLAIDVARSFVPLEDRLDPQNVIETFGALGIGFGPNLLSISGFSAKLQSAAMTAGGLPALIEDVEEAADAPFPAALLALTAAIEQVVELIGDLGEIIAAAVAQDPQALAPVSAARAQSFGEGLARMLVDDSVIRSFESRRPATTAGLTLLGAVERRFEAGTAGDPTWPAFVRRSLQLQRIAEVLRDPAGRLQQMLWHEPLDAGQLLGVVDDALAVLGVPVSIADDGTGPVLDAGLVTLKPFGGPPVGATLKVRLPLPANVDMTLPIRPGLSIHLTSGAAVPAGAQLTLAAPATLSGSAGFSFEGALAFSPIAPATAVLLFGGPAGVKLEASQLDARAGMAAVAGSGGVSAEPSVSANLIGGRLSLDLAEADGLVGAVVPQAAMSADLSLGVRWSPSSGLRFTGSGGAEVTIPVAVEAGPAMISAVLLRLSAAGGGDLTLAVGFDVRGALGPVQLVVSGVGAAGVLKFVDQPGKLGPFDFALKFAPPEAVGIAINAGPVTGGGFISQKDGRYAGALELKIYGVAVQAFGVIDTKMPDGNKGFSFVIVISAEFTAIQLGLGFTLLGVGGLLGINRRLDAKALESAVRDGHLANVLFPTNVIARAPEIIRDLTTLFPAAEDRYVFGPMAKIGWGTPTLIRAEIGVILELPGPILSLLGEVRCALPKEDAALVKLNLSVAGRLDFPGKSFELFAALHDSEIAGYKVKGQMAMRLRWGPQPVFALAVGGFHPAFSPPPGFPALQPMAVDLGKNGNPGITLSGFFAITSNTVQVGGALALRASGAGVTLEATLSVKAIFVFSPFSFEAEIDARVRVSFHGYGLGVRLHGMLSGPSPWRIRGSVCVSVLWWDACLSFDKSFGGGARVDVPTIDPFKGTEKAQGAAEDLPGLEDAIKDPRSWEPVAPAGVLSVVSLAQGAGEVPPFDPMGGLSMRQKVVPLETREKISRFGVAKAESPRIFKLMKATVGESSVDLERGVDLKENFAPAQFFEVETRHKLSAPSFVEQVAGYTFTAHQNDAKTGSVAGQDLTYETIVVDTRQNQPPAMAGNYDLPEGHMVGMLKRSAGGLFGVARLGDLRYIDPERPDRFGFKTPKYVPADRNTLTGRPDLFAEGNKLEAVLAIEAHVRSKPSDLDTVQVVPDHELAA